MTVLGKVCNGIDSLIGFIPEQGMKIATKMHGSEKAQQATYWTTFGAQAYTIGVIVEKYADNPATGALAMGVAVVLPLATKMVRELDAYLH
jgi:hypothetical protein